VSVTGTRGLGALCGVGDAARLDELTRLSLLDTPPEESLDRLTRLAARLLAVPVALVSLVDGDRQFFKSAVGLPEPWASARQTPLSHSFCAHVVGDRKPLVIEDARADPRLRDNLAIPEIGVVAYAGVPLVSASGHVVGSFCAIDTVPRRWHRSDIELLGELAASAMAEMELRVAAADARRAHQRLSFLVEASTALSGSLDHQETLANVTRLALDWLADWCSVALVMEDGSLALPALAHADPARAESAEALRLALPSQTWASPGVARVLASGEPQLHDSPRLDELWPTAPGGEQQRLLTELGVESVMVVPMRARGRTLGTITFVSSHQDRRYDGEDLLFALDLATRAAMAVDNARLYEGQRTIARTLQRSLLPPRLPDVPGLDVAASYEAAGEGVEVGGDFYDLFDNGDRTWGVVVGDVCGKGPEAASLTALARWTVRVGSMEHDSPAAVLGVLNEAILMQDGGERFCTVAVGRIEVEPGRARVRLSCGGHPPAFVLRAEGPVEVVGSHGTLIGVLPTVLVVDDEVELGPGDALVLVTDGVLEARDDTGRLLGAGGVAAALAGTARRSAQHLVDVVQQAAHDHQGAASRSDDRAVLALVVVP
jgi:GAF domain-containing protein